MREVDIAEEEHQRFPTAFKVALSVLLTLLVAFAIYIVSSFDDTEQRKREVALAFEEELDPAGDDDHRTLRFAEDVPPIYTPQMEPPRPESINSEDPVIGIIVGDQQQAFLLRPAENRQMLLISTTIGNTPILIAHNYALDKTRVLTGPGNQPLNVNLGGWEYMREMVLMYKDVRYRQSSEKIPLSDHAFERTSMAKWLARYPESQMNYDQENEETRVFNWPEG